MRPLRQHSPSDSTISQGDILVDDCHRWSRTHYYHLADINDFNRRSLFLAL